MYTLSCFISDARWQKRFIEGSLFCQDDSIPVLPKLWLNVSRLPRKVVVQGLLLKWINIFLNIDSIQQLKLRVID